MNDLAGFVKEVEEGGRAAYYVRSLGTSVSHSVARWLLAEVLHGLALHRIVGCCVLWIPDGQANGVSCYTAEQHARVEPTIGYHDVEVAAVEAMRKALGEGAERGRMLDEPTLAAVGVQHGLFCRRITGDPQFAGILGAGSPAKEQKVGVLALVLEEAAATVRDRLRLAHAASIDALRLTATLDDLHNQRLLRARQVIGLPAFLESLGPSTNPEDPAPDDVPCTAEIDEALAEAEATTPTAPEPSAPPVVVRLTRDEKRARFKEIIEGAVPRSCSTDIRLPTPPDHELDCPNLGKWEAWMEGRRGFRLHRVPDYVLATAETSVELDLIIARAEQARGHPRGRAMRVIVLAPGSHVTSFRHIVSKYPADIEVVAIDGS